MSEIKPSTAKKRQDEAKRKLIERLRAQQPIDIGPWTRDELYDTDEGEKQVKCRKPTLPPGGVSE